MALHEAAVASHATRSNACTSICVNTVTHQCCHFVIIAFEVTVQTRQGLGKYPGFERH